ncbi:hypothetical protein [Bradyrhizobium sp. BWA-3-5]|uniref:hypothetical protein n=1 Tax=Bradyrhizobium sp. BWA-3-5 TaxID=3080013 RepID=UPI00293E1E59|nr:hypothetical protein [Bradyrhizobium sp. BWA-3-5]WOH64083.1 hypothetical protein RX331_26210 [Bradyrhizobium sp. BWA-3-5]WOH64209.1 hypothetical protein RX331_27000 [Bradyrhizobium sp. BWA-3-5]WOH70132.1 hypothetical protein RX331_38145 [Bradyrhizobium sp. BWA-3-5]
MSNLKPSAMLTASLSSSLNALVFQPFLMAPQLVQHLLFSGQVRRLRRPDRMSLSEMKFGERPMMLSLLLAARAGIILWVTFAIMPLEIAFDAIEDVIDREMAANG